MRVGGGAGRIELGGGPYRFGMALLDLVRRCRIGQIAGHQRFEIAAGRPYREDTGTIGDGGVHRGHGRHQVWHDDAAGELPCREWKHRAQHLAVAQMNVPVVRTTDRDAVDRFSASGRGGVEKCIQIHGSASLSNSRGAAAGTLRSRESRKHPAHQSQ